ncbi:small ribosomal subunit protein mS29-like [Oscarella lobularis]|uniref:small ribosomal subunit protein mS29-like n=1 Tax=Oscarella lobularis TaxID=121494 RepID=UPI0033144D5D
MMSMRLWNAFASRRTGNMSRNRTPGLGKSGWSVIRARMSSRDLFCAILSIKSWALENPYTAARFVDYIPPMSLSLRLRRLAANRSIVQTLCTSVEAEKSDDGADLPWKRPYLTKESDPLNHSTSDLSFLYQIPSTEYKALLSHGLPRSYRTEVENFGQAGLLIRRPAMKIIKKLQDTKNEVHRFLINGPDGCGKSLTLAHVMHFGFKAGWLIVHLPSALQLVHSSKPVRHSYHNPTQYDQPDESVTWLKTFRTMNSHLLNDMTTCSKYTWGKKDVTHVGDPLGSVIDQGIQKPVHATDAVGVLLKEVALQDNRPILFAVDDFNGFFGLCSVRDPDGNKIAVENLRVRGHFLRALKAMKCGSAVMALSRSGMLNEKKLGFSPGALLRKEGLAAITPHVNVRVDGYNEDEIISMINYYASKNWLTGGYTKEKLEEIAFLTQKNPIALRKLCDPY